MDGGGNTIFIVWLVLQYRMVGGGEHIVWLVLQYRMVGGGNTILRNGVSDAGGEWGVQTRGGVCE